MSGQIVRARTQRAIAIGLWLIAASVPAGAAEASYPFEGTWARADLACTATVRSRSYTAKEVVSPRGRCSIRRVAANGSVFELQEECRTGDRNAHVTETIRMTSPDAMGLRRQLNRLKITRQVRYARCNAAAPGATPSRAQPKPAAPEPKKP